MKTRSQQRSDNTWIVAGSRTQVWFVEHPTPVIYRVVDHEEEPRGRLKAGEVDTDRDGMSHDPFGHGDRPMERNEDPTERIQSDWARQIAEWLRKARARGDFHRLVLVAEPGFLGALRQQLDDQTARLVVACVDKQPALDDERQLLEDLRQTVC